MIARIPLRRARKPKRWELAPALIRIDTNAGHGLGTPVSMLIEQNADVSFALFNIPLTSRISSSRLICGAVASFVEACRNEGELGVADYIPHFGLGS